MPPAAGGGIAFRRRARGGERERPCLNQAKRSFRPRRRAHRADRAEAVATLVALLWVSTVAIVFAVYGGNVSLVGFLAIAPFIAAAFARPSRVLIVGLLAAFFALVISTPPHSYGELNHTLRVVTQLAATAVAMWISYLRGQRNVQLWTARSETRNERRRRVAAETAQRMQAMARALTTAADPAQVADAVFAALRDELRVDAATFALSAERAASGRCAVSATSPTSPLTGCSPRCSRTAPCWATTSRSSWSRPRSSDAQRPDVSAALGSTRFHALAIVPLVVSDHTIGAVIVHWDRRPRDLGSRPQLPLHHHRRGGPGRGAGPAHAHGVRQPGAQPAPAPAQLRPGCRHHTWRRGPRGHRRWPSGSRCAVRRRARPGRWRARPRVPRQQRAPGAPLPRHGARRRQPCGRLLRPRAHRRGHDRTRTATRRRRGHGGRGRAAGAARTWPSR